MKVQLGTALQLIQAAQQLATARGEWATVVVVDDGGHLVALHRADQATLSHTNVAISKAYSAAISGKSTEEASGGPERAEMRAELRQLNPGRTFLRGGFPIYLEGVLAGGLGVAGSSGDLDVACGKGALETLSQAK